MTNANRLIPVPSSESFPNRKPWNITQTVNRPYFSQCW
jgi:hypothetical protein